MSQQEQQAGKVSTGGGVASLLSAKQQKLAYYLAQGAQPALAASICGVTPGYVSQLLRQMREDKEAGRSNAFADALAQQQAQQQEECSETEQLKVRYLSMEHRALNAIENKLQEGTLREQVSALQAIADIQDRRLKAAAPPPASSPTGIQFNITQVMLPGHALTMPKVELDSMQRVVAVDQQPMAALTGMQVRNMFMAIKQQQAPEPQNQVAVSVQNAIMQAENAGHNVIEGQVVQATGVPEDF